MANFTMISSRIGAGYPYLMKDLVYILKNLSVYHTSYCKPTKRFEATM